MARQYSDATLAWSMQRIFPEFVGTAQVRIRLFAENPTFARQQSFIASTTAFTYSARVSGMTFVFVPMIVERRGVPG
jgi:hypothetical protein